MNPGVATGTSKSTWKSYTPKWMGIVPLGQTPASVQPDIGNGTLLGRYNLLPNGMVVGSISLVGGSTTVWGTGDNAYIFGLPLPFNRWDGASLSNIGSATLLMGDTDSPSRVRIGTVNYSNQSLSNGVSQGIEDYYCQIDAVTALGSGTGTITGTNTSTTITHSLGCTPYAYDIEITPTALTAGSATLGQIYVDTITSTQFNVNVQTAPGVGKTLSFSWKADVTPGASGSEFFTTSPNSQRPWTWATGHKILINFCYEPRA